MASVNKYLAIALGIVFGLVGLTVVLNVSQSTIPDASEAFYNLMTGYNATAVGDGAAAMATSAPGWLGYLWVVLPFAMIATILILIFRARGR